MIAAIYHPISKKYWTASRTQCRLGKALCMAHRLTPFLKTSAVQYRSNSQDVRMYMDRSVEKLLYSRRDTAEALSLSIRSIDYLITSGRLPARRVGGKILIPASAVRRFAREDHPDSVRSGSPPSSSGQMRVSQNSSEGSTIRFQPQSQEIHDTVPERATGRH